MVSSVLAAGLTTVYQQLTAFAGLESFWTNFDSIFGTEYNLAVAQSFRAQWQSGNFSQLPTIEVIDDQILGKARGAYASSTNIIYLSDAFVETASPQALEAVLIEEFGHFVDAQVNTKDTAGDEGELFSALVRGVNLSATELSRIKTEDDHAVVTIGGQETVIEQSAGTIIQLTNNNINDRDPQISGNNMVWVGSDGNNINDYEIYFYNGTTTQLTNDNTYDDNPQISGNNVVWVGVDGNDQEIYFYNGTTTTQLTSNTVNVNFVPQISGNNVVWTGWDGNDYEIYFYNGTTTQLTNNNTYDYDPQISGNNVVWWGSDGNEGEIYFYNGTITIQLTNNSTDDYGPQISGNNVVWMGSDGDGYEIYYYNGTTTIQLTNNNSTDDYGQQISGNNIAWMEYEDIDHEIYFYNGTTTTRLTNNSTDDYGPQISGNNVVWMGLDDWSDGNDYEIYFYNGTTTTQLTDNNTYDGNPQISGNNIVWMGSDGNDYEIYTYQISPALPTLSIAPTNASQAEGNSGTKAFTFTVTRSVNTTGINAVNWTVTGSGTNPANITDFAGGVFPTGTVSFAAGETSKVITVNVQGDLTNEPNDGFAVTLSSPTNGATISTATASGTIQNDDFPSITLAVAPASVLEDGTTNLVYTFTRTGATTNALTVNYGITGTATNGTDYATIGTSVIFAANSATATVTVNPTADTTIENNETVALTLATGTGYTIGTTTAVTGTITNDDFPSINLSPNGQTVVEGLTSPQNLSYTVSLSSSSTQTITVQYSTANGTALAGSDYTATTGTLTFNPGVTSQTISIPILNDSVNEANETFTLKLTSPTNAILGGTATVTTTITDTLSASTTTTLPANVENLTLTGSSTINGTGNTGNNVLTGNSVNNTLNGGDGNDTLNGGTGVDTLIGGLGNDIYQVDSTTDVITENASEGTDTIQSSATFSLAAFPNIENLTLTGSSVINGTGNAANNSLNGNTANNTLDGGDGNDTLNGGAGNDSLIGGNGNDYAYYYSSTGSVTVNLATGTASDGLGGTDTLSFIENVQGSNTAGDNITGSTGNNVLYGYGGNDTLNGGDGNDTLIGGTGNDLLTGGNGNDTAYYYTVTGAVTANLATGIANDGEGGTDTLSQIENVQGSNTASDNLTGNTGVNVLYGYGGADILTGGLGNDSLYVGSDTVTDTVNYASGDGADTVYNFVRGAGGDLLKFTSIAAIDVQVSGTNTLFKVGDGISGNSGFGSGTLLLTTSATSGFVAADVNVNLLGATFAFS